MSNITKTTGVRMAGSLWLNFYGVVVYVQSENARDLKYIRDTYALFERENASQEDTIFRIDVYICKKHPDFDLGFCPDNYIGSQIYADSSTYKTGMRGGGVFIARKTNRRHLEVLASRSTPNNIVSKFKVFIKNYIYPPGNFMLCRQAITIPVLWALSRFGNKHTMHASAINTQNGSIIFEGLAGIGKTTLAVTACLERMGELISDNYLLFDDDRIYPFLESIRIDRKHMSSQSSSNRNVGTPFDSRYGRDYYRSDLFEIGKPTSAGLFLMPSLSTEFKMESCELPNAIDNIFASYISTGEFPEHYPTGLLDYIFTKKASAYKQMIISAKRLLINANIYSLKINKNNDPKDNLTTIINNMPIE